MADPNDPFASMGGGVKLASGGWVPKDHPLAQQEQQQGQVAAPADTYAPAPAPAAPAAPTPTAPTAPTGAWDGGTGMTPQQAQAAGLGWVPVGHPLYGTAGFVGSTPATSGGAAGAAGGGSAYVPPNLAPGTPGSSPIDTQNSNAQTYSQTPGAAPADNTTNQGTQDTVRNSYLQQIQKGTSVNTNDPNFRMQADAFAAAQERARRNQLDDVAQSSFQSGSRGSGAEQIERRMMDERAAQNVGSFEAELVGKELASRRDEIKNALSELGGMISNDQKNDLNRELAALDAAIKRESLAQTGSLGGRDLDLRDKLGTGALNIDMLRALLQNEQFGVDSGIRIGDLEAKYSGLFG
jgi:hypothetical protein